MARPCSPRDRSDPTGHGRGQGAMVLSQTRFALPALEVMVSNDDISRPTNWLVRERRHTVVVHLGGQMDELATELDGHGGSRGAALPGEVWTIPAGRSYASQARGGLISYAVLFLETASAGVELAAVAGRDDAFLHETVRSLAKAAEAKDDVSRLRAEALSLAIQRHVGRAYTFNAGQESNRSGPALLSPTAARALRDYIHDNLSEPLTLPGLAAVAGLTAHQLLIAFRRAFGQTPAQYIIAQRLRAARRMLLHTRKDITTVALESGFSSHSHLTSTFGRHLGLTPSRYRQDRPAQSV